MNSNLNLENIASWAFGLLVLITGAFNLVLVHWVPGILYMLLSVIYLQGAVAVEHEHDEHGHDAPHGQHAPAAA